MTTVGTPARQKRFYWLKPKPVGGANYVRIKELLRGRALHTVCEEARCPNIGECFDSGTATFLILGEVCSRSCAFCAIAHGRPQAVDPEEPERVARMVQHLGLEYAVVTSVTRDDLPDGGASIFAETIRKIGEYRPECRVEVLIPDFKGAIEPLQMVLAARPEVLNHNVETVPRLYRTVRPQARYERSLELLHGARELGKRTLTKSGLMVGVGETWPEILQTMADLRAVDCQILTIGQYLSPSSGHLPVERYYAPQEFEQLRVEGLSMGFTYVEAGPLVRSSYHAHRQIGAANR